MGKWTRRAFIAAGGIAGGGLLLGIGGIVLAPDRYGVKPDSAAASQITTWLRITPDNVATVLVPHCEMGQGVHTALPQMLADELDADWALVRMEEAPALDEYANGYPLRIFFLDPSIADAIPRATDYGTYRLARMAGLQLTGGSSSIRATGDLGLRVAGAAARALLVETAAKRWGVPAAECTAALSFVRHPGSGRSLAFGALAEEAARLPVPSAPPLKARGAWRIMGRPVPRFDVPGKVDGSAQYGIDMALPDLLYATVSAAPVFGGKLVSVDEAPARAVGGVTAVVRLADAVAVVADSYWRALKGLQALAPHFDDGGHGAVSSTTLASGFAATLGQGRGSTLFGQGDVAAAATQAAKRIEAEYAVPFLAHAPMEPMNATARFVDGRCEIWSGTQDPINARETAAKALGIGRDRVVVHNRMPGGGFGRRLPFVLDFIEQAALVARAVSPRPVKLIWSREEDIRHDFYRPAALCRFAAGLDAGGRPSFWSARFIGNADEDAARLPYVIPHQLLANDKLETHVRTGAWRSVDHSQHGFFVESFVDELAHAAGKDPFEFRRDLLPEGTRHRRVLETAAEKAGWRLPLPAGSARGIALCEAFGSIACHVVEVELDGKGRPRVGRVTTAVDCGDLVNPDIAAAQVEGGIMFGLAAALYGEITIDKGAVVESNFWDYEVARLTDTPDIAVHFIDSGGPRGGLGEPGVPPVAPAVANAVFALTGTRIRSLPFKNHKLSLAAKG
jgi:isoquinoline 1-oxidoreductase beta subunit